MTYTIPNIEDQYSLRIPAHHFQQGGRDVYSFALDLETLDGLLPQRVEDDVVRDANRRLTPSHAKNIENYLSERDDWLLGSLLLGISPEAIVFKPYPHESGEESAQFGELRIRANRASSMRIFDGQHRRRAIRELLRTLEDDQSRSDKFSAMLKSSLPIVLYVEEDIRALQQMFADAAKTKPIEANTVVRFDQHDAFNLTALWLAEESKLFSDRVEMERTTVPRASRSLIAINQLAACLKTLDVGYNGRVRKDRNEAHMMNRSPLEEKGRLWADEFLPAARAEYEGLVTGSISDSDVPNIRASSFAYNATVIRVMAGCCHEWSKERSDWSHLAAFLRNACLTPGKGQGALLVDAGLVIPNGTTPNARIQEVTAAIRYIVTEAKK